MSLFRDATKVLNLKDSNSFSRSAQDAVRHSNLQTILKYCYCGHSEVKDVICCPVHSRTWIARGGNGRARSGDGVFEVQMP